MRPGEIWMNYFLVVGVPMVGAVTTFMVIPAIDMPEEFSISTIVLLFLGSALITIAKLSVVRRGTRFSWGSKKMTSMNRKMYRFGYLLFGIGLLMTLALYAALKLSFGINHI